MPSVSVTKSAGLKSLISSHSPLASLAENNGCFNLIVVRLSTETSRRRRYIVSSSLAFSITSAARLSASIYLSPIFAQHSSGRAITSYKPYFISGPKTTALFDGIVHGVVVHITTSEPLSSASSLSVTLNLTQIVKLSLSWYSISASANAVFSIGDHITGFEPW